MGGVTHPYLLHIFKLFATLSIVWTGPSSSQISSRIAFDPGDPLLNNLILWYRRSMPSSPRVMEIARSSIRCARPKAVREHLARHRFLHHHFPVLGGTPLLAYDVALGCFLRRLSGFFSHLLSSGRLTGSSGGHTKKIASMAFAHISSRRPTMMIFEVLTSRDAACMARAHAYVESGRRKWLAVFGVAPVAARAVERLIPAVQQPGVDRALDGLVPRSPTTMAAGFWKSRRRRHRATGAASDGSGVPAPCTRARTDQRPARSQEVHAKAGSVPEPAAHARPGGRRADGATIEDFLFPGVDAGQGYCPTGARFEIQSQPSAPRQPSPGISST